MRIVALAVGLACTLAGCTTTHLVKPGATMEAFQRDHQQCEAASRVLGPIAIESRYRDCMLARGYRPH